MCLQGERELTAFISRDLFISGKILEISCKHEPKKPQKTKKTENSLPETCATKNREILLGNTMLGRELDLHKEM